MMTQRPRWSEPAETPEEHPADARASAANGASTPSHRAVKPARDRKWVWPQTLRLAILISGAFWLLVALAVWVYFGTA
jgi:hypothetical protein